MDTKPWYQSKGVLGGITSGIPAVVILLKVFGIDVADLANEVTAGIIGTLGFIGTIVAVYGRLTAKTVIAPAPTTNSKYSRLLIAALLPVFMFGTVATAPLILTSCATILPGNDQVLVNAERTTAVAYDTFDSFFALERSNDALVKESAPEVHAFANSLRDHGKTEGLASKYLKSARAATEAYRTHRTPENKANLDTYIAVLKAALDQVQFYTAKIATLKG